MDVVVDEDDRDLVQDQESDLVPDRGVEAGLVPDRGVEAGLVRARDLEAVAVAGLVPD